MVQISDDLLWALAGKRNSFTRKVKNSSVVLSTEPGNLTAINSRKTSTLMSKAVSGTDDGRGNTTLGLATKAAGSKPSKSKALNKMNGLGRGTKKCNKSVKAILEEQYYRSDLTRLALARVSATAKAGSRKAAGVKYTPKTRSNKK